MKSKLKTTFFSQFFIFIYYFSSRMVDLIAYKLFGTKIGILYKVLYSYQMVFNLDSFDLKIIPKASFQYPKIEKYIKNEIAIIIAGPYVFQNKFTYNSLRYLRELFPHIPMIFSTDSFLNQKIINKIKNLNIEIIFNEKIPFSNNFRIGNLKSQINNINSALARLDLNSDSYVLRLRSDQFILKEDFLLSIVRYYDKYNGSGKKILKLSMNSYFNRRFSTSDMFMFARLDEMKKYWEIDDDDISRIVKHLTESDIEIFPESIIDSLYFYKIFGYPPVTHEDYLMLIIDKFIFIDECNVNLLWHKSINLLNFKIRNPIQEYVEISHSLYLEITEDSIE